MCKPARTVTAGAVLMSMLGTKAGFGLVATVGSGAFVLAVAGSALNAWVIMILAGGWAITLIALLAKRANPVRQVAPRPAPAPPVRATVHVLEARPVQALPAASPAAPETITTHTAPYLSA